MTTSEPHHTASPTYATDLTRHAALYVKKWDRKGTAVRVVVVLTVREGVRIRCEHKQFSVAKLLISFVLLNVSISYHRNMYKYSRRISFSAMIHHSRQQADILVQYSNYVWNKQPNNNRPRRGPARGHACHQGFSRR